MFSPIAGGRTTSVVARLIQTPLLPRDARGHRRRGGRLTPAARTASSRRLHHRRKRKAVHNHRGEGCRSRGLQRSRRVCIRHLDGAEPSLQWRRFDLRAHPRVFRARTRLSFGGDPGNDQRIYFFNAKEVLGNRRAQFDNQRVG